MDTYEYHTVPEYSAKKASPYADSDYVTPFDAQQPAWQLPPTSPVMPRKKSGGGRGVLSALLVIALVVSCCGATAFLVNAHWEKKMDLAKRVTDNKLTAMQEQIDDMLSTGVGVTPSDDELLTPGQVYEQNVRAVVAVSCMTSGTDMFGQMTQGESTGSGFLISEDGYVVTNYHVVEGGTSLKVTTKDGREYQAQIVGYEDTNDICVLKIRGDEDFPCVKLGSSDRMAVGDQVVAIGCPLGELTSTLTVGYVSAKDRFVTTDGSSQNMLQTDAAINSGNSGGPLFNMLGEVIGITTAKYSGTSSSGATIEGIGFAIPISDVEGMISDLVTYGYINGVYLGVSVRDVSADAQAYGLPAGAYVADVVQGYAADRAGVKAKDIIVNVGGYAVRSLSELSRVLQKFQPGQTTTITVYRSGGEVNLDITLDEKPGETPIPEATEPDYWSPEDIWGSIFG